MTEGTPLDDRGRFTVEPKYRKLLGRHVLQVRTPDGILLMPVKRKLPRGSLPPSVGVDGDDLYWKEEAAAR